MLYFLGSDILLFLEEVEYQGLLYHFAKGILLVDNNSHKKTECSNTHPERNSKFILSRINNQNTEATESYTHQIGENSNNMPKIVFGLNNMSLLPDIVEYSPEVIELKRASNEEDEKTDIPYKGKFREDSLTIKIIFTFFL